MNYPGYVSIVKDEAKVSLNECLEKLLENNALLARVCYAAMYSVVDYNMSINRFYKNVLKQLQEQDPRRLVSHKKLYSAVIAFAITGYTSGYRGSYTSKH